MVQTVSSRSERRQQGLSEMRSEDRQCSSCLRGEGQEMRDRTGQQSDGSPRSDHQKQCFVYCCVTDADGSPRSCSSFFTYKENGLFLNTERGSTLLKSPVPWVTCTPSK